jgi:hypothetical protein
MEFTQRILAAQPGIKPIGPQPIDPGATQPANDEPRWVIAKPYMYDMDAHRMLILKDPTSQAVAQGTTLVFAAYDGANTLEFGFKWVMGSEDESMTLQFAHGLDLGQVNHFYSKQGVPVPITVTEICYLLTGIEEGLDSPPIEGEPIVPQNHSTIETVDR